MADIFFKCPNCDGQLVVDDRGAGMQLPCPYCSQGVVVPPLGDEVEGSVAEAPAEAGLSQGGTPPSSGPDRAEASARPKAQATPRRERGGGSSPNLNGEPAAGSKPEAGVDGESSVSAINPRPPESLASSASTLTENEDDPAADLQWVSESKRSRPTSNNEIQRLAAMMQPEEPAAPTGDGRGALTFRCPSCGQVLSAKRAWAGDRVTCTNCQGEIQVPVIKGSGKPLPVEPRRPRPGALPSGRNPLLRTADDIRKGDKSPDSGSVPPPAPEGASPISSNIPPELQQIIAQEIQRLSGGVVGGAGGSGGGEEAAEAGEKPAPQGPVSVKPREQRGPRRPSADPDAGEDGRRRRPLPPLAQHAEVVTAGSSDPVERAESPRREGRTRPVSDSLPPLVALDTIDLDSEVARQWGAQAVVPTSRLNWLAWMLILGVLAGLGYLGYERFLMDRGVAGPEDAANGGVAEAATVAKQDGVAEESEADEVSQEVQQQIALVLNGFHRALSAEEKLPFVRPVTGVEERMKGYYHAYDDEPKAFDEESLVVRLVSDEAPRIYEVRGDYLRADSARHGAAFLGSMVEVKEGAFLLDWDSWAKESLDRYQKSGTLEPVEMRVWVRLADYYSHEYHDRLTYQCYLLKDPTLQSASLYGYTELGSSVDERLKSLLASESDRESFDGLGDRRLILKLQFEREKDALRGQVQIQDIISESWIRLESGSTLGK